MFCLCIVAAFIAGLAVTFLPHLFAKRKSKPREFDTEPLLDRSRIDMSGIRTEHTKSSVDGHSAENLY